MRYAVAAALTAFALAIAAPLAAALVPPATEPIANGGFDLAAPVLAPPALKAALDRCVGIGHQVIVPLYSPWGDWALGTANDVATNPFAAPGIVFGDTFVDDATGYPVEHARAHGDNPSMTTECDAQHREIAEVNPWERTQDRGVAWSNDPGTRFADYTGDGDAEAVIPTTPVEHNHNLWQSMVTPAQAYTAAFDRFEFTLEAGSIPTSAKNKIGLSLSPLYAQHPFVGVFYEGAVVFDAADMAVGPGGRVSMDPVAQGRVECPSDYPPCFEFKSAFDAGNATAKRALLSSVRMVQISFWSFNSPAGAVVIDDVAFVGAGTVAEAAIRTPPPATG